LRHSKDSTRCFPENPRQTAGILGKAHRGRMGFADG
jgi:hypothetical protein